MLSAMNLETVLRSASHLVSWFSKKIPQEKLTQCLTQFAMKFCEKLDTKESIVCSPVSAEICLALLALGSEGQTRCELMDALLMTDDDQIRSSFSYLRGSLEAVEGVTLNVANKLFVKEGRGELRARFKTDVEEVFGGNVEQVDFGSGVAAGVINNWVSKKTEEKIKNIVPERSLGQNTVMVIVNAIYFKGTWEKTFDKTLTKNGSFHINNNTTIEVPMMTRYKTEVFGYQENNILKAKMLKMNYKGSSSVVIVLPNDVEGLGSVMTLLAAGHDVMNDVKSLNRNRVEVDVTVPKFKIETTIDIIEVSQKLGIKSIFDAAKSEIKLFDNEEKLSVSEAIQKAFIEVNEEGTEAAAATYAKMLVSLDENPMCPTFVADHPFLFLLLIQDIPIFTGVYRGEKH